MKVLIIGKYSAFSNGGIERVVKSWLNCADALSQQVFFRHVCFSRFPDRCVQRAYDSFDEIICSVDFNISSQPISLRYLIEIIKNYNSSEVIVVHLPNVFAALCVYLVNLFFKKRIIVYWHADLLVNSFILRFFGLYIQSLLLKFAAEILCTTRSYADNSEQLAKFSSKIKIFPIYVKDRLTDPIGEEEIGGVEVLSGKPYILSVGRLVSYKGFDLLIEAYAQSNLSQNLIIIGTGPLEQKLQSLIVDKSLCHSIQILSNVNDEYLQKIYKNCSFFVLASNTRAEAFGIVLLEASIFGKALISSDMVGSGVSEINIHGVTGLSFQNNSPHSLSENLELLGSDQRLRDRLGAGARENFVQKYSENLLVGKIEELL